jgi:phosphoribosyl-AMP cyclohydrolase
MESINKTKDIAAKLQYKDGGLLPAIIQDNDNGQILMLGYMNEEAVEETLRTRYACFYSRSRQKLWRKGESSGHRQLVKRIFYDCDSDTLLLKVEQTGAACHLGYRTCFFTEITEENEEKIVEEKVFDPDEVYKKQE